MLSYQKTLVAEYNQSKIIFSVYEISLLVLGLFGGKNCRGVSPTSLQDQLKRTENVCNVDQISKKYKNRSK
jgi:hypothetical protein